MGIYMKKHTYVEQILQGILLFVLIGLLIGTFYIFRRISGTSRVINYSGIVRGCTQRVVKLELQGQESDDLIDYLDEILDELQYGGEQYNLIALPDSDYQQKLSAQEGQWTRLKQEITSLRADPTSEEKKALLEDSEAYYKLCDKTVSMAESYSKNLLAIMNHLEVGIVVFLAGLVIITLHQSYEATLAFRRNKDMEGKFYLDALTGIKNRRYYTDVLCHADPVSLYSVIFIDLDHLKNINDTLGHEAGDLYIRKTAEVIRGQFRSTDTIIRMGGDEFLLFLPGCNEEVAERLIQKARHLVKADKTSGFPKSFSYGICCVEPNTHCTIQNAVEKADQKMYTFKKTHRACRS